MPDNWRDTLACLLDDDALAASIDGREPEEWKPHYDENIRANSTPPEQLLASALDRDELHALQSAALDTAMRDTGRTIREPHLTHAERQARLRGIPAIGSVGGAIKGTRPDHA